MAKINLEYITNLDPLLRAGQQIHSLNTEAQQLGQTMTGSFRKANENAETFDKTIKKTSKDVDGLSKEIDKSNKNAESFGSKLSNIATGFVAGQVITGGLQKINQAFSHAIDIQKEFEKSVQNLSAITGASGADLDFYKQKAIELGLSVKGGATAAVEAFKLIGSAQPQLLANKEALAAVTEEAILLSKASGLELPDAATRLTDAMNQFGASSDEARKFVDTLAAGAKFGAAEVPQVTDALLKFGVAAKASNINVTESVAAIELLGEKGLKGAEAGTALRNVFAKLSATKVLPKEAKQDLEKAGVDIGVLSDKSLSLEQRLTELSKIQNDANALTRVFGLENKNAAQSILQNLPRLKELTNQLGVQGVGSATEQAAKNMDTLDQALLETENQYNNMILSLTSGDFGNLIKGFVKDANESLKSFANQIKDAGILFQQGFGALQESKFDDFAKNFAEKLAPESRRATAQTLANEIKLLNAQLQSNSLLTDDQRKQYAEQVKNKAKLVNAILDLDKKQSVQGVELIQESAEQATEIDKEELNKRKKLREDFEKALLDLNKRVQAAQLERALPEEKIRLQQQFANEELDLYKDQFIKVAKLNDANFKLSVEQEQQFATIRNAINLKAADDLVKLEVDKQNRIAQARIQAAKQTAENLALEEQNLISGVGLTGRPSDVSEADFELVKQRQILAIQQEYAIKKLELKQESIRAEREAAIKGANGELELLKNRDDEESNIKRKQILDNLSLVEEKYARENEAAQDATAKLVNDIQRQRDDLDRKPPFNLLKYLGLSSNDLSNLKIITEKVVESINSMLDSQITAYDDIINKSKERQDEIGQEITDLQGKLENEQELGQRGLANNQDKIRAEIALKEEQQAKEKELELRAIEEKKKIQKQKLLLDTITQGSNMILAATEIYARAAAEGGPLGVPIAVAAIAAMFTAFATQKALALQAINEGKGFKDGVIDLQGPGTETSDSIPARLSKGESVITAKVTRKRKSLLEALATDSDPVIKRALLDELKGTGITINAGLPKELSNKKDAIRSEESKMFLVDNSKMERELLNVNKSLLLINKENKNKIFIDQNGNLHKKFGSHTTIIRKKNG